MRTKLFLAFFAVILLALVSNFIFERLIIKDFEEYVLSSREDQVYRVLAAVEGIYSDGWDTKELSDTVHWAAMLGFETEIRDRDGNTVITTTDSLETLAPAMRRRMESLVYLDRPTGEFEQYPLYLGGEEIGSLLIRPIGRTGLLMEKESLFKRRGRNFLVMSFFIAGGGALFLSLVFSLFLTVPLKRLKSAAEAVAEGDLDVRVKSRSGDEIGRLTATFNNMVESLQREELLRQHLTSNIAHELRTPLTILRTHLEAIADGVIPDSRAGVRDLATEVNRLINLVEGIEDITKAEASFFKKPVYETIDVRDFLQGIAQSMRPMFTGKGLTLELAEREGIEAVADVEKLELIVRNIVTNALWHTDSGGATIDYGTRGEEFYVEVTDTGAGIAEEELPKIFERFYKGASSEGVGLGLSIAKELLGVMNGSIDVASTPGKGSTFTVRLPLKGGR